jgi:hypothetical protein
VVDFSNPNDLVPWLRRQPREFAVVIAARAALRAVPALASSYGTVLPVCRAVSVAWVASAWPEVKVGQEAAAAAAAADDVAEDDSTAAMVARVAAWAAYAAARTNPAADAGATVNSIFRANIEARDDVRAAVSADAAMLASDRWRKLSPAGLAVRPLWPKANRHGQQPIGGF